MGQRARPARGDGGLEHGIYLRLRNHQTVPEALVPFGQRSTTREQGVEPAEQRVEVRLPVVRWRGVVQGSRLLIEGEPLAAEHPSARGHRAELDAEIAVAQGDERIGVGRDAVAQDGHEGLRSRPDVLHRHRIRRGHRPEGVGAVVGVDVIRVVLAQAQAEDDVAPGHRVQASADPGQWGDRGRTRPRARG